MPLQSSPDVRANNGLANREIVGMMELTQQFAKIMGIAAVILLSISTEILAQEQIEELAASLTVLNNGVEVRRSDTVNWIPIRLEAIIGVGDTIRTDETGTASIIFFADGIETDIQPQTVYHIERFEGSDKRFNISVEVLAGQTLQRINRALDAGSNYEVNTPGASLAARGTEFAIRVEDDGRSSMLVFDGIVDTSNPETTVQVPPAFGIRAPVGNSLSDVVRVATFGELDAALDGCQASAQTLDDVRLNVRIGPTLEAERVATIDASEITVFVGTTQSGDWYRIPFREGFGWILSRSATVSSDCAGLRVFPDDFGPEDISLYTSIGDVID